MKTIKLWVVVLAAGLPAAWFQGQDKADARASLLRAIVIEEQEHDVQGAIAEYQRLTLAASLPSEVRAEAKLRLGLAWLRAGNQQEGKAALEAVVAVGGALGERARQALDARSQQDSEIQARVVAAIALLRQDAVKGGAELRFLGAPAAATLSRYLWLPPFDRAFLTAGVGVLLDLDDAVAAATVTALAKADVYVRRSVANGLKLTQRSKTDAAVLAFLRDADPEVRANVVRRVIDTVPVADLSAAMADGNATVRDAVFGALLQSDFRKDRVQALLPVFAAEVGQGEPVASMWPVLWQPRFAASAEGMSLTLRAVRHARCPWTRYSEVDVSLRPNEVSLRPNECLDEALATAESLVNTSPSDGRRTCLRALVKSCEKAWDRAALEKRIRLQALGYGNVGSWLLANGQASDLPLVLDNLEAFSLGEASLGQWLTKQAISAERWRAFADYATADPRRTAIDAVQLNEVTFATYYATRTWHVDGMAWLAQFAPTHAHAYLGAADAFSRAEKLTPEARAALTLLVAAEVRGVGRAGAEERAPRAQPEEQGMIDGARMSFVRIVAKHGVDEAAPALIRAHELLSDLQPFFGLLRVQRDQAVRLSDDAIALVVAGVLEARPAAFEDAGVLLQQAPGPAVYRELCRRVLSAPETGRQGPPLRSPLLQQTLNRHAVDPAAANSLFIAAMRHADRRLGEMAASAVRNAPGLRLSAEAVAAVVEWLRAGPDAGAIRLLGDSRTPSLAPVIASWLTHADPGIRGNAALALSDLQGAECVEQLLPMFDDPHKSVREWLCSIAGTHLDRRFVPGLLKLLRDPDASARAEAQKSLEAIEYYVTQTERWQRLLRGTGLEANTAAEALLGQAKAGNDQRVRLAALRSLGALGVKETLPFLIQMMQEPDAEIAAAASAAVDALSK